MFGLLALLTSIVGSFAFSGGAAPATPTPATPVNPTPAPSWDGQVGGLRFNVRPNGSNWAWQLDGEGSGSEATQLDALRAALRTAQESGKLDASDTVGVFSPTRSVIASVYNSLASSNGAGWLWELIAPNANGYDTRDESEPQATRGAAIVGLLEQLKRFVT